jgi:predicted ester cyclase
MKKLLLIIPLVFLLCFTLGCQQPTEEAVEEGITEEEARAMGDRVLEMWNEGNLSLAEELCAPEVVMHHSSSPENIVGLDGVKNSVTSSRTMFPNFNMTFDEVIVKGNNIVTRWTATGTNTGPIQTPMGELPATNKNVRIFGLSLSKAENGKIVEEWVIYNVLDMMQQLGFTLNPPQPPEEKK